MKNKSVINKKGKLQAEGIDLTMNYIRVDNICYYIQKKSQKLKEKMLYS